MDSKFARVGTGICAALFFAAVMTGCQPALVRTDTFILPSAINLRVMSYDASRRGVFILKVKNEKGQVNTVVCPEPPPDVAVQYATAISGAISASAKANGGIINPLGGVGSAVSPGNLRDMLTNLAKGGDKIPSIQALSSTDLANAAAAANVTVSGSYNTSMTPTELHSAQTLEVLRNSEFWACINQANSGEYSAKAFSKHQALVEAAVAAEIVAQNGAELSKLKDSLATASKGEKKALNQRIKQLQNRQEFLEKYNDTVIQELK